MKSKMMVGLVAFTACLALAETRSEAADNTTCENAIVVVPNGSAHTGTIGAGGQRRWFKFVNKENRSYSIEIEDLSPIDPAAAVSAANMGDAHAGSCTAPFFGGNIERSYAEPVSKDSTFSGGDRNVILPPSPGLPGDFYYSVSQNVGESFRTRVEETTLYSPAWTTKAGAETHWTVQNTTNEPLSGTLVLFNTAGAIVLKVDLPATTPPSSIPAGGSYATDTVMLGVANNRSGSAVFFHNGPPGSVQIHSVIKKGAAVETVSFQTRTQMR
jgi:hypothetical protein